jgi:RNA-directed DNA polymerase
LSTQAIGEEPMDKTKPYLIPKQLVMDAYLRMKANNGAAGIDEVTVQEFEKNLKNNL